MEKIGLIAGNRKFPLLVAAGAKKQGYSLVAVCVKGDTLPAINKLVDKTHWLNLSEFSQMFEVFSSSGITKVIMAGQISPYRIFSKDVSKDETLRELLANIKDKKADTIFGAVASKLQEHGLELIDSTLFIKEFMPDKGILTRLKPDTLLQEDILFGFSLAKAVAGLDIGQTVAVKDRAIVAVEALEGTDNLIRRSCRIVGRGLTIVKVSKPKQDIRFDVPVVGLNTIRNCIKAGARCLAFEAKKTLFIDKEESISLADKKGLILAVV